MELGTILLAGATLPMLIANGMYLATVTPQAVGNHIGGAGLMLLGAVDLLATSLVVVFALPARPVGVGRLDNQPTHGHRQAHRDDAQCREADRLTGTSLLCRMCHWLNGVRSLNERHRGYGMTRTISEAGDVWDRGTWRNSPVRAVAEGGALRVTAAENSDAWRHTSYGFVHDSAHALLAPLPAEGAMEVSFLLDYTEQFDQAGIYLHVSDSVWIKAGVEVSDGVPQVGAVVTQEVSDWSVAPVPEWIDQEITVRLSRAGNAVTIRARAGDEPFRLIRVAPLKETASVEIGPFCASPTRAGLTTTFTRWIETDADATLHPEHD